MVSTVILVDDHAVFRDALCAFLEQQTDLKVIAQTGSGQTGCALAEEYRPDVVVVDIELPDLGGLAVTEAVQRLSRPPRVLILSVYAEATHWAQAVAAGAAGYICKDESGARLVQAIRTVAQGGTYFPTAGGQSPDPQGRPLRIRS